MSTALLATLIAVFVSFIGAFVAISASRSKVTTIETRSDDADHADVRQGE